jgi:transcription elongation factor GreA
MNQKGKQSMDTQFLTSEGHQRVLSQLEFLRTVKRVEVAQHLREVVEAGDFVGNAVYEDVKGEQAIFERRILELEHLLAIATLIEKESTDVASLGSVIHLTTHDGREYRYTIVGSYEANPCAGLISNESPVGKALLGHRAGDRVEVNTPGGVKEYALLSVE